jgi:hypothetical protein
VRFNNSSRQLDLLGVGWERAGIAGD